jgi:hypothetical protein
MTIVKVQIPLVSSDPDAPAMIYDELFTHMTQQHLDIATLHQMAGEPKVYFNATWSGESWQLGVRAANQKW